MKQLLYGGIIVVVLVGLAVLLSSRGTEEPVEADIEGVEEQALLEGSGEYEIVPSESQVEWFGRKTLVANWDHAGTVDVVSGNIFVDDGMVTGGEVVIDMTSIAVTRDGEGAPAGGDRLSTHLKSDDFFSAETYPEATFVVTDVVSTGVSGMYDVTGEMTIKGTTEEVTFPARIGMTNEGELSVKGSAELDRTLWDVRYGSGKFFSDLGDNLIDDTFTIMFDLVAEGGVTVGA